MSVSSEKTKRYHSLCLIQKMLSDYILNTLWPKTTKKSPIVEQHMIYLLVIMRAKAHHWKLWIFSVRGLSEGLITGLC